MNDEAPRQGRSDTDHLAAHSSERDGRLSAPTLVIELMLEESGRVQIRADSHDDEVRLRLWLRHCSRLPTLAAALKRYLDYLDERETA